MNPSCGPCNHDCNQGRACPARLARAAGQPAARPLRERWHQSIAVVGQAFARLQAVALEFSARTHREHGPSRGGI